MDELQWYENLAPTRASLAVSLGALAIYVGVLYWASVHRGR